MKSSATPRVNGPSTLCGEYPAQSLTDADGDCALQSTHNPVLTRHELRRRQIEELTQKLATNEQARGEVFQRIQSLESELDAATAAWQRQATCTVSISSQASHDHGNLTEDKRKTQEKLIQTLLPSQKPADLKAEFSELSLADTDQYESHRAWAHAAAQSRDHPLPDHPANPVISADCPAKSRWMTRVRKQLQGQDERLDNLARSHARLETQLQRELQTMSKVAGTRRQKGARRELQRMRRFLGMQSLDVTLVLSHQDRDDEREDQDWGDEREDQDRHDEREDQDWHDEEWEDESVVSSVCSPSVSDISVCIATSRQQSN